jgi:hypothetical protein
MDGNGRQPPAVREQAHDARVRDDIGHRAGDHVEQALVVRRRLGERAQCRGQDVEPMVGARISV